MNRKSSFLTPMLALSMTFAIAGTVQAENRYDRPSTTASGTLQINFGSAPHWTSVNGTQVQVIRQDERPDYDMFRYNNRYYVYRDNRWYQSDQWRGSFDSVDERSVPVELSRVPRDNWRSYPSEWQGRNDYDRTTGGTDATFQVSFGSRPRWGAVRGTRVMEMRSRQRPDYDVFRYGGTYYVYSNDRWYSSDRPDGAYRYVDDSSLPRDLRRVPRNHWRHYPQGWQHDRWGHDDNRRDRDHR